MGENSERDTQDALWDLRYRLIADTVSLGKDEIEVLIAVCDRLRFGLKKYGGLKLDEDRRDWAAESESEIFDCAVYLSCRLIQERRGKQKRLRDDQT